MKVKETLPDSRMVLTISSSERIVAQGIEITVEVASGSPAPAYAAQVIMSWANRNNARDNLDSYHRKTRARLVAAAVVGYLDGIHVVPD